MTITTLFHLSKHREYEERLYDYYGRPKYWEPDTPFRSGEVAGVSRKVSDSRAPASKLGFDSKSEDAVVDLEETDILVPILVEECTSTPKQALHGKIKEKMEKAT